MRLSSTCPPLPGGSLRRCWAGALLLATALAQGAAPEPPAAAGAARQLPAPWLAAQFCSVDPPASDSATPGTADDRLRSTLQTSRLLKARGCDDAARAALQTVAGRDGLAGVSAPLRCVLQAWQARLAALRQLDEADTLATAALACSQPPAAGDLADAAAEALATRMVVALSRGQRAAADLAAAQALALPAAAARQAELLRLRASGRVDGGDRAGALADCEASLAAARVAADAEAQGLALVCLGHLRVLAGSTPAAASPDLAAARQLALANGLRRVLAVALFREGSVLARSALGRHVAPALAALQASAALVQAMGDTPFERAVQLDLAQLLLRAGQLAPAQAAATRAALLSRQAGLLLEAAKAEQTLGTLARLAEPPELAAAERHFDRALADLQAGGAGADDLARLLGERAGVATARGDAAAALAWQQQALALIDGPAQQAGPGATAVQALVVDLQAGLGWTLAANRQADEAALAWRLATQSADPMVRASAWWGLAQQARDAAPEVALSRYGRAAAAVADARPAGADAAGFDRRAAVLLREYSAFLADRGQLALAHQVALLTQQAELRARDWVGTRTDTAATVAAPSPLELCDDTLQQVERDALRTWARHAARRQTSLELCCRDDADTPVASPACTDPALPAYCPDRRMARAQRLRLTRLQDDCMASVEEALRSASGGAARQAASAGFATQWARAASEGAPVHLVVTIVEDSRLIVLVHAPGERQYRVRSMPIAKAALLRQLADLQSEWDAVSAQRRAGLRTDDPALAERARRLRDGPLRTLYQQLFGAFDPPALPADPAPGAVLAFVPDGPLRELPLGALFDGQRHLLERWAPVLVTPTTLAAAPVAAQPPHALVMGVSEPDLPHVAAEVRQVGRTLGVAPLLNAASTRQRVREWLAGVESGAPGLALHLAAHAAIGPGRSSSHIRLWGDERITGDDLDDWRDALRRVRLVALSACRSSAPGRGDMALGLSGIAEKGARSVLGSLWPVDDESTAVLMGAFYDRWMGAQPQAVAAALAQAQRAQMRSHPHPYFWAAFQLVGRWD